MTPVSPDPRVTNVTFDPSAGANFAAQLTAQSMPSVDFDALSAWLSEASHHLAEAARLNTSMADMASEREHLLAELSVLREDYQLRIAGMLKAVTIADRSRTNRESLADLVNALPTMSADDLVRAYRRTAAVFRDHFPGSFALPK